MLIRKMGIRAMATPLDGYEGKCINMCKPAGSAQEILATLMKPSLSLTLSSPILCFMTGPSFPSSFPFPSSLSPRPSPFFPPHHFLPPQTLSSAPSHIPLLSPLPGAWASFVSHARPRLSGGRWGGGGLPRLKRVRWSTPGWRGGSSPIWKGHCALLPVLPASCCLPAHPRCLAPRQGSRSWGQVGCAPHWECPPHCAQPEP